MSNKSFAELGLTSARKHVTRTLEVAGMKSTTELTESTVTLPRAPAVQATFSKEGFAKKVLKIFSKEIQVGDKAFDDQVYISTDTPTETAAWLKDEGRQATILTCVVAGGSVEIRGPVVTVSSPGHDQVDDPGVVRLVESLLV